MFSKEYQLEGTSDVKRIPGISEQQFFLLIRKRIPDAKIIYEGAKFSIQNGNGQAKATIPDFRIERRGMVTFVEVTTANINGKHPKARQIAIMSHFPNTRFVVLTKENLVSIQTKHTETDFFNSKKIK